MFVYLDYASLFPPVPEALDRMRAAAESSWGQPRALHGIGARARYALDEARQEIAEYVGTLAHELVFVGSGREALIRAFELALARLPADGTIVSSRLEHPSLQRCVEEAARSGRSVRWLALPEGVPTAEDSAAMQSASLVALSLCNHELGTTLDVAAVAPDAIRIIDAVQAAPWLPLDALNDDRTFYALSGSKLGAPMGAGVLRVPSPVHYAALEGGGPGLEGDAVPWSSAIGMGAACTERAPRRAEALRRAREMASRLLHGLRALDANLVVNGAQGARLGPILNVSFPGMSGKAMVSALSLHKVCISHTAACQARLTELSPVVRAAYPGAPERAEGATRWSVSEHVTDSEIDRALEVLGELLARR